LITPFAVQGVGEGGVNLRPPFGRFAIQRFGGVDRNGHPLCVAPAVQGFSDSEPRPSPAVTHARCIRGGVRSTPPHCGCMTTSAPDDRRVKTACVPLVGSGRPTHSPATLPGPPRPGKRVQHGNAGGKSLLHPNRAAAGGPKACPVDGVRIPVSPSGWHPLVPGTGLAPAIPALAPPGARTGRRNR
jgi:hypothetical protein